jgi:hypothetical protein
VGNTTGVYDHNIGIFRAFNKGKPELFEKLANLLAFILLTLQPRVIMEKVFII